MIDFRQRRPPAVEDTADNVPPSPSMYGPARTRPVRFVHVHTDLGRES